MQLSVLQRIVLIMCIPLIAFIVVESISIRELLKEITIVEEMDSNVPLFAAASTLVDRLQKERGTTVLWISKVVDQATLRQAQEAVDAALSVFGKRLPSAVVGTFALEPYQRLESRVRETRTHSAALGADSADVAITAYSAIIADLLKLQGAIVNARTTKGLGKILGGLLILEYTKESAGQLRALGGKILAHDQPVIASDFTALIALKAEVDAGLKSPALILSKASQQKLAALPASAHWQETEQILLTIVHRASAGGFGIAPTAYFRAISQKIDDLGAIVAAEIAELESRLAAIIREEHRRLWSTVGWGVAAFVLVIGITVFFAITIVRSIKQVSKAIADIAQGEGDLSVCLAEGKDELGQMARDFNCFIGSMANLVRAVREVSHQLDGTAGTTKSQAQEMEHAVDQSAARAKAVASAAEQMEQATSTVAQRMEEAIHNLETVAAAAEEMSATVQEVAGQTTQARTISQEAAGQVAEVQRILGDLVAAAQEIGSVSEAIASISSQTNLLALNATIEAARAGEAGRGFAVVANEIKELANQTAQATGQIRQRIEGVQGTTTAVNGAVDRFAQVFRQVGNIVEGIAGVIDDQAQAMREIATNIAKVSAGVTEAGQLAKDNAQGAMTIAGEIKEVHAAGARMHAVSQETLDNAQHLANLASELRSLVGRFRLE